MHVPTPFNPFLRALFAPGKKQHDLLSQLDPPTSFVILAPTSESLQGRDKETGLPFEELCGYDDFQSSHIFYSPSNLTEAGFRSKPKGLASLNGKTVVVRDDYVYTNRGFGTPIQARLLCDKLYSPSIPSYGEFLVYYISRPLIGVQAPAARQTTRRKREIHSFEELLRVFPTISQQVRGSMQEALSAFLPTHNLEAAVDETISQAMLAFQNVEPARMKALAEHTTLTGTKVEHLIERYVCENLHDIIFTAVQTENITADQELAQRLRQMESVDVSEVGIATVSESMVEKLNQGIEEFRKLNLVNSPMGKLDIVLRTLKTLSEAGYKHNYLSEKSSVASSSADILVSLFLLVVIRAKVERLESNISYMRRFSQRNVESGESAYALSSLEAIVYHIREDDALVRASKQNAEIVSAVRRADIAFLQTELGQQAASNGKWRANGKVFLRDSIGDSLIMAAIKNEQIKSLRFLLSHARFDARQLLRDFNYKGVSTLSAAVQMEYTTAVEMILDVIRHLDAADLVEYFAVADTAARTVGHYLFHLPGLIPRIGRFISWEQRDKNGQTPLFALCRAYDHPRYSEMVKLGMDAAEAASGFVLDLSKHIDEKGNTLLHIVSELSCIRVLLSKNGDFNAVNTKGLTPLMLASRYGRFEMMQILMMEKKVDLYARDHRGLTAVELAMDENFRDRLDNLILYTRSAVGGRVTSVVRTYLTDSCNVGFIIKSGMVGQPSSIVTVRRSFADFKFLVKSLRQEQPASFLPTLPAFISPFLIPSRPSRSVSAAAQTRLDGFLKSLLRHDTFGQHQLVWEFILIPDLDQSQITERSKRVAESAQESLHDAKAPHGNLADLQNFIEFAKSSVQGISDAYASLEFHAKVFANAQDDLHEAWDQSASAFAEALTVLPKTHTPVLRQFAQARSLHEPPNLREDLRTVHCLMLGLLVAFEKPSQLLKELRQTRGVLEKHRASVKKQGKSALAVTDEKRARRLVSAQADLREVEEQEEQVQKQLLQTQVILTNELSVFHETRADDMRAALRRYASGVLEIEKVRLAGMKQALGGVWRL